MLCDGKLASKSLTKVTKPYNEAASTETIFSSHSSFFTNSDSTFCPITNCVIKDQTCSSALAAPQKLTITGTNFDLTASVQIKSGYTIQACYECEVNSLSGQQIFFTNNQVEFEQ